MDGRPSNKHRKSYEEIAQNHKHGQQFPPAKQRILLNAALAIHRERQNTRNGGCRYDERAEKPDCSDESIGKSYGEIAGTLDLPWMTAVKQVRIVCGSGSVNIRVGNDTKYGRITSVKDGTTFEWVATAENGWHAIVVNAQIGWVSGK